MNEEFARQQYEDVRFWTILALLACVFVYGEAYFYTPEKFWTDTPFIRLWTVGLTEKYIWIFLSWAILVVAGRVGNLPAQKEKRLLTAGSVLAVACFCFLFWKEGVPFLLSGMYAALVFVLPETLFVLWRAIWESQQSIRQGNGLPIWVKTAWLLLVLVEAFACLDGMLNLLIRHIHITLDPVLHYVDAVLGLPYLSIMLRYAQAPAWEHVIVGGVYGLLSMYVFIFLGILWRNDKMRTVHGLRVDFVPLALAPLFYLWIPGIGPAKFLLSIEFSGHLPELFAFAPDWLQNPTPTPRNAMPSFHFIESFLLFAMALALRWRFWTIANFVFFAITAYATVALGEHYLIDLIVAAPLGVLLAAALMRPRWCWPVNTPLARCVWGCGALVLVWMLLIRLLPLTLLANRWLTWLLTALSVLLAVATMALFTRQMWQEADASRPAQT